MEHPKEISTQQEDENNSLITAKQDKKSELNNVPENASPVLERGETQAKLLAQVCFRYRLCEIIRTVSSMTVGGMDFIGRPAATMQQLSPHFQVLPPIILSYFVGLIKASTIAGLEYAKFQSPEESREQTVKELTQLYKFAEYIDYIVNMFSIANYLAIRLASYNDEFAGTHDENDPENHPTIYLLLTYYLGCLMAPALYAIFTSPPFFNYLFKDNWLEKHTSLSTRNFFKGAHYFFTNFLGSYALTGLGLQITNIVALCSPNNIKATIQNWLKIHDKTSSFYRLGFGGSLSAGLTSLLGWELFHGTKTTRAEYAANIIGGLVVAGFVLNIFQRIIELGQDGSFYPFGMFLSLVPAVFILSALTYLPSFQKASYIIAEKIKDLPNLEQSRYERKHQEETQYGSTSETPRITTSQDTFNQTTQPSGQPPYSANRNNAWQTTFANGDTENIAPSSTQIFET